MVDFIVLVVLVAWFFGISYGAALHGVLSFFLWGFLVCVIVTVVGCFLDAKKDFFAPTPVKKAPKRAPKLNPHPILKWIVRLLVSYFITFLLIVIISNGNTDVPLYVTLLLPLSPFLIMLAVSIMGRNKKRAN